MNLFTHTAPLDPPGVCGLRKFMITRSFTFSLPFPVQRLPYAAVAVPANFQHLRVVVLLRVLLT